MHFENEADIKASKNISDLQKNVILKLHNFIQSTIGHLVDAELFPQKSIAQLETSILNFATKKLGGNFITPDYSEAENLSYLKQRIIDYLNTVFKNIIAAENDFDRDEKSDQLEINRVFSEYFGSEEKRKESIRQFTVNIATEIATAINQR